MPMHQDPLLVQIIAWCCQATNHLKTYDIWTLLWIKFISTSCEIAFWWIRWKTFDGKSTLVKVMVWCHQATSYQFKQFWPRFMPHMMSLGHNEWNHTSKINEIQHIQIILKLPIYGQYTTISCGKPTTIVQTRLNEYTHGNSLEFFCNGGVYDQAL